VKCPTKAQLEILQTASLRMEATLLPESFESDLGESQHRLEFAKAVAQKIFCWIDTKAVLHRITDNCRKSFLQNFDARHDTHLIYPNLKAKQRAESRSLLLVGGLVDAPVLCNLQ
jgi:hypothetical protein